MKTIFEKSHAGRFTQGHIGGRFAQSGQQIVRHAAAEVDHSRSEDVIQILLPAIVAAPIDRNVDRLQ